MKTFWNIAGDVALSLPGSSERKSRFAETTPPHGFAQARTLVLRDFHQPLRGDIVLVDPRLLVISSVPGREKVAFRFATVHGCDGGRSRRRAALQAAR